MLEILNAGLAPDFVPYHDGWALQRQVHAEVVAGERARHAHPARARGRLHRGQAHRTRTSGRPTARPSSTSTAAARSRGTARVSSSAIRSSACPSRSTWSPTCVAWSGCSSTRCGEHGVDGYRVEGRSGVWVRRPLSEDKIAAIGVRVRAGRDDARLRGQLRQHARGLPRHHPVRDHGCRGHDGQRGGGRGCRARRHRRLDRRRHSRPSTPGSLA